MAESFAPDSREAEATVMVGRTLRDKWHLDSLLDVGGMAAVYAATHRNGMRGAVKILHADAALSEDVVQRFKREGYIANRIGHPGALRVIDDDTDDDGRPFLVMELLEGATLSGCATAVGGKLPAEQVLVVIDQLLDVLAAAHELGIVHRDVKPENVFLTVDGRVKVLDFGIARSPETTERWRSTTAAGMPMGSPGFMSPEQARGRWDLVDAQSDVWSVGATMFTLLSGELVHVEETLPELLAASFTKDARSLATVVPDAHPALVSIVDRALERRLASRWPDARSMRAAVRETLALVRGDPFMPIALPAPKARAARSATTVPPRTREVWKRLPRTRKGWVAVALAAACMAGVAGVSAPSRDARSMPVLAAAVALPTVVRPRVSAPDPVDTADDPQVAPPSPVVTAPPPPPPRSVAATTVTTAHKPLVLPADPGRSMFDRRH